MDNNTDLPAQASTFPSEIFSVDWSHIADISNRSDDVIFLDAEDPQTISILQKSGLTLSSDGTLVSLQDLDPSPGLQALQPKLEQPSFQQASNWTSGLVEKTSPEESIGQREIGFSVHCEGRDPERSTLVCQSGTSMNEIIDVICQRVQADPRNSGKNVSVKVFDLKNRYPTEMTATVRDEFTSVHIPRSSSQTYATSEMMSTFEDAELTTKSEEYMKTLSATKKNSSTAASRTSETPSSLKSRKSFSTCAATSSDYSYLFAKHASPVSDVTKGLNFNVEAEAAEKQEWKLDFCVGDVRTLNAHETSANASTPVQSLSLKEEDGSIAERTKPTRFSAESTLPYNQRSGLTPGPSKLPKLEIVSHDDAGNLTLGQDVTPVRQEHAAVVVDVGLPVFSVNDVEVINVCCSYCNSFSVPLKPYTWNSVMGHFMPLRPEEVQLVKFCDIGKYFIREMRFEMRKEYENRTVAVSNALVCRCCKQEFVVDYMPSFEFVESLARHATCRKRHSADVFLCLFCSLPFSKVDYSEHIEKSFHNVASALTIFCGSYCANSIREILKSEIKIDFRFLPCTRTVNDQEVLRTAFSLFKERFKKFGKVVPRRPREAKCSLCYVRRPAKSFCSILPLPPNQITNTEDQKDVIAICRLCQEQFLKVIHRDFEFETFARNVRIKRLSQFSGGIRVVASAKTWTRTEKIYSIFEDYAPYTSSPFHFVRDIIPAHLPQQGGEKDKRLKILFVCRTCNMTTDVTGVPFGDLQLRELLVTIVLEHILPQALSPYCLLAPLASSRFIRFVFQMKAEVKKSSRNDSKTILLTFSTKWSTSPEKSNSINKNDTSLHYALFQTLQEKLDSANGIFSPKEVDSVIFNYAKDLRYFGCSSHESKLLKRCSSCADQGFSDVRLKSVFEANSEYICEDCIELISAGIVSDTQRGHFDQIQECLILKNLTMSGFHFVTQTGLPIFLSFEGATKMRKMLELFKGDVKHLSLSSRAELARQMLALLTACVENDQIKTAVASFNFHHKDIQKSFEIQT